MPIELKMLGFFANTDDILVDVLIINVIVNQWGGKSSDVKGMYDYQKTETDKRFRFPSFSITFVKNRVVMEKNKVFAMKVSKVYPLLVAKVEKKNRTRQEVDEIICWLTGYNKEGLQEQLDKEVDFTTFFNEAPQMNPNCGLIKGVVCGCRVEEIEDPLMQKIRYLDKLVDELAKGKAMEKILRK